MQTALPQQRSATPRWGAPLLLVVLLITAAIFFATAGSGMEPLPLPPNLPTPNCRDLGLEECRWEGWRSSDGKWIKLELRAGKQKIAEVELSEETLLNIPEFAPAGIQRAWMGYVNINSLYRGLGFGRLAWQAGDIALRAHIGKPIYRAFVDSAGWGPSLMQQVTRVVYYDPDGYWIYLLP